MPKRHGKKYIEAAKKVEAAIAANGNGGLTTEQAVALAKDTSISKFDATVEAHIRLGVDPRHAEQMVRGSVVLPNGTGKKVRVAVFAVGDRAREARPDVSRRPAWKDPRTAGPDAQPEIGHGHQRRGTRRARGEGRQGRVPDRQVRHRPRSHRQGVVRLESAAPEPHGAGGRADPKQADVLEGSVPAHVLSRRHPGALGPGRRQGSREAPHLELGA